MLPRTLGKRGTKALLLACAASFLLLGCVTPQPGPRYVEQITSSKDTVKLLYSQPIGEQTRRGLIECDRAADGALQNCQNVNIHFNDEE
ncbi:hypothetical protein [Bradymonas sediminis]|uniref:hypothetical protein n=1 Tax=Bradymonas sediminis TaxID=1548548 RepID=UPI00105BC958|nr:hypothetical protein [Bradymonas sediminis]TDP77642.1 hypothetical protein DFR33_101547 [Bradymonas sediminis]